MTGEREESPISREYALYAVNYFSHLMTSHEKDTYHHVVFTLKHTGKDYPDALARAEEYLSAFRVRTGERILREHPEQVFLNTCPKCGGLKNTPRARQCPQCLHMALPARDY